MTSTSLETDYLVIGAGATSMAFVDTLLTESPGASVVMVDRYHRPGGHWNVAYPFVRLHQPAAWYGVASRELGGSVKEEVGLNAGLYGLASGAEALAHFELVMRERFLPSGRVSWMPMSEYLGVAGDVHRVNSLVSGATTEIRVRRKLVDGRHARTEVPATHPPRYAATDGVRCIPVGKLPDIRRAPKVYTVIGSGKTGIDACLWLLEHGVSPARIRWIMPRDAWYFDRANFQPGLENFERNMAYTAEQMSAITEASSLDDLFARLEACGALLRLDSTVAPSTFRCAIVSRRELAELQRIGDVVRRGRVLALESTRIVLAEGVVPADPDTLYVDCSASAIQMPPDRPVFDGDVINLLMVRTCQPLFSAAVIAYVQSHIAETTAQNEMCAVVPSPEYPIDWLRMWQVTLANTRRWRQDAAMWTWLGQCRLNGAAVMMRGVAQDDEARMSLAKAAQAGTRDAMPRLQALLAQADCGRGASAGGRPPDQAVRV